ncbi:AI-2E family transporter [Candidatus Methylacidiphilum infernorum]|uniref:Predicted permease, member of the PurR regulon n=1 Tax=Methylacidiphilum infernorum (isolate V4) TaxID=481448 RepID=B3E0L9_METI4|nr:AI-2E family transporter [Candidatus Methylacidiphilum infernorum]ACD82773.1 Predicted permease, member of the PurR regulon [Methylacidiphilum infernorum V4]
MTAMTPTPYQKTARVIASILFVLLAIWILRGFIVAMAWAFLIAIATWPFYSWVRMKLPRNTPLWVSSLFFTLLVGALLFGPLVYGVFKAGQEAIILGQYIAHAQKEGAPAPDWFQRIPFIGNWLTVRWNLNLATPEAASKTLAHIDSAFLFRWGKTIGVQVIHRIEVLAFTLLTLFFLYRDGRVLGKKFLAFIRKILGTPGEKYAQHLVLVIRGTVNGLVLVSLGEGILLGIAYAIVGLPDPVTLGGVTGILAMIPFAAPPVFCTAALFLLAQGMIIQAIAIVIFGFSVLFVADHFIRPALIGGAVNLPFYWVLLGTLGGLSSFGLLGLFAGPTIIAALLVAWKDFVETP